MGFLSGLFGGGAAKVIGAVGDIADEFVTTDEERASAKRQMYEAETERLKVAQAAQLAQIEVNKVEAAHRSVWVAGWRPGMGWACVAIFTWVYLLRDVVHIAAIAIAPDFQFPPVTAIEEVMTILLGMLGLGGIGARTAEKMKGVAK